MDNKSYKKSNQVASEKSTSKTHKRTSLTDGVPMLDFGSDTNLREVERCLQLMATMKFGNRLDFFEQMKYPKIKIPKYNVDEYKNQENFAYRIIIDKQFGKFAEQEIEADTNKPKFYAMIMGILSADGESAVKRHSDFKDADGDPLALWKIVKSTHLVSSSNSDSEVIRQRTRSAYSNLMMGELEKPTDFKGRFDYSLQAYNDAGNAQMSEVDVCLDYLNKLNEKHSRFRADMLNAKTNSPDTFPKTLADLYARQGSYVLPDTPADVGETYKTAFMADWRGGKRSKGAHR